MNKKKYLKKKKLSAVREQRIADKKTIENYWRYQTPEQLKSVIMTFLENGMNIHDISGIIDTIKSEMAATRPTVYTY